MHFKYMVLIGHTCTKVQYSEKVNAHRVAPVFLPWVINDKNTVPEDTLK